MPTVPTVAPSVTSFLASLSTSAQPVGAAAPAATQLVQNFKNQQLGGVLNNQTPLAGAGVQTNQATSINPLLQNRSGTETALDNNVNQISQGSHDETMQLLAQAKQNNDAKAAAAANAAKGTVSVSNTAGTTAGGGGQAYTPSGSLDAERNQVLKTASSYLGDRYVFGGTSHAGIDCSGLVMAVYAQMGFTNLPHNARIQGQIMGQRTSVSNLRPGDLVAWDNGSHIAIYAGNGNIIEAANPRVGVVERKLWSSAVYGVRLRLPGE